MKTLILGDIHGRNIWKDIIESEEGLDHIIFMGDYFDSFDIPGIDQLHNFKEILRFKEETDIKVTMLIGNHDHHYLIPNEQYSGFQPSMEWNFVDVLKKNLHHLQIAYQHGNFIFTHAGISPIWLDKHISGWSKSTAVDLINELYEFQPEKFNFSTLEYDAYGNSRFQGPLWIRERALMKSNKGDDGFKKNYIQIVGHTPHEDIFKSFEASKKSRGSKYYFVDALENGGYAIIENGNIIPKQYS